MATIVTSLLLNLAILLSGNAPENGKKIGESTSSIAAPSKALGGSGTWSDAD